MRSVRCLLLATLLLSFVPPAGAQDLPLPPPVTLDDPAGDLEGAMPGEGAGFVDIVHAEVVPSMDALDFRVTVADLTTDAASGFQIEFWLDLEYRGVPYHFTILGQTSAPLPAEARSFLVGDPYAVLYRMDDQFPPRIYETPGALDLATRTWNATLPWSAIEGGGYTPQPGEQLRLREVATVWDATLTSSPHQGTPLVTSGVTAADVAAFPEGTFLSIPGAVGDLALTTPLPVRTSNGEATTFHWPVEVINLGARELDVNFTLDSGIGEGRVPPGLRLPPAANATINVYVTVPFQHQHGTTSAFPLTARTGTGDVAILDLGVDYPAVAQPAGHHPDLYLHGSVGNAFGNDALPINNGPAWMNTLEEDPRATGALLMPREENCPLGEDIQAPPPVGPIQPLFDLGSYWAVPLQPALAIGLDGRTGDLAALDLELVSSSAMPPGTMHARLTRTSESFDGYGPFANHTDAFRASIAIPAQPGPGRVPVHLDIPMPPALDLVAPSRSENLVLALMFCLDAPAPAGIPAAVAASFAGIPGHAPYAIEAGAHLRLALDEYHDAIPVRHSAQGLFLTVDEPTVQAAPGATVVFRPRLSFPPDGDGEHAVRLFGTGASNARLLGAASVRGPQEVELPVAFVVPDAAPGEVFDLLLDVTHAQDPTRAVALRLTVVVDPASTRDDAAQLASLEQEPEDAPAPAFGVLLLALAMLAWRKREA